MNSSLSQRTALLTASTASFLVPFMGSAVNVALPAIGRRFHLDAVALTWLSTCYLLTAAGCLLPCGRLADLRGRRRVFVAGLVVDAVGSLLCATAVSAPMLLTGRLVQGLGGALIFSTGVAILTSVYEPGERGRALGLNTAAVYLGLSVGPCVGGALTGWLGWRTVFCVGVVLGLWAAGCAARWLPDDRPTTATVRFDGLGALLYGPSLAALMLGFTGLERPGGALLLGLGVLGLGAFAWWELRTPQPLLEVRLLVTNRAFALSNLAALINYMSTAASGFLLSLFLQNIKGFSPPQTGTILLVQPALMAACSPLAGRLSDQLEPRLVASCGMALTALGLTCLIPLHQDSTVLHLSGCLALLGIGFGLFSSPNVNAIMSSVEPRWYGVASASMGTMRVTGQMLSMGLVSLILAAHLGAGPAEAAPAQFLAGSQTAYAVYAVLCALGILASLARGRLRGAAGAGAKEL